MQTDLLYPHMNISIACKCRRATYCGHKRNSSDGRGADKLYAELISLYHDVLSDLIILILHREELVRRICQSSLHPHSFRVLELLRLMHEFLKYRNSTAADGKIG